MMSTADGRLAPLVSVGCPSALLWWSLVPKTTWFSSANDGKTWSDWDSERLYAAGTVSLPDAKGLTVWDVSAASPSTVFWTYHVDTLQAVSIIHPSVTTASSFIQSVSDGRLHSSKLIMINVSGFSMQIINSGDAVTVLNWSNFIVMWSPDICWMHLLNDIKTYYLHEGGAGESVRSET